jgi:hypothetical protein
VIILVQAINIILSILGVVAFIWLMVGGLPGIVLLILALTQKDTDKKAKLFKWVKICFGGLGLLVVVFILYALMGLLGSLLGFSIATPLSPISK